MAENGRTGLERGPQPHIIASPPGTGAPIDRINYTPETGEVHAPGVLAPIDKLNYSLVPHDELQAGGNVSPPGQPPQGGGPAAGTGLSSALQPANAGQRVQSNVWKNTGQGGSMGMGADSIVASPGTPAGTDGLMGRYGENAALRTNQFSPGQPPLSPTPYGTGPGPRVQASGPTARPVEQRGSMTGNLQNWGMGTGADDDGDGYDDDTGEPVSPEDAIYGSSGGSAASGGGDTSGGGGASSPAESQPPTTAPSGYHFMLDPPNGADGQPPRGPGGAPVRQTLWLQSDTGGKANIPIGYYDAQYKAGTSERPFVKYAEKEQRAMSPDYAKELDANLKTGSGRQIIEQMGGDGKMHRVLVDKEHPDQGVITDYGVSQPDKAATPGQEGNTKIYGQDSPHPTVLVQGADGKWTHDAAREAQMARDYAAKQQTDVDKQAGINQARIDAATIGSTPYAVHQDSAGQTWIVNEQTGAQEKLGGVDPKAGIYESNGRLLKLSDDGKSATEMYKPPPGYDIHYDTYGRAIAVNKDDPSKTQTIYTPEDYEDRKAIDRQKALADIEKSKSDLATAKITQADSRMKMLDSLQKLEHPEARFIGSSDIYLPSGAAADVQRYNPETKTSTYEHVSGGDLSDEQKANIARMRSLMDEMDKALAGGDTQKANAAATEIQKSQTQQPTQQPQAKQEDQPGLINLGIDEKQALAANSPAGAIMKPGWPGEDPRLQGAAQPPTTRTTAAGDIAHYDAQGNLTGIDYKNTAPPDYEGLGSTLAEGLEDTTDQGDQGEQDQTDEYGQENPDEVVWDPTVGRRRRRSEITGAGTDIPQGGQGTSLPDKHRPAGNPGYDTTPTPQAIQGAPPPPGAAPVGAPPMGGATSPSPMGGDPTAIASQPGYNPLKPPDLAALGPPGGGGGTMPGIQPGAMPSQPGALPNTNDPLFQFAMQRRQAGQGAPMGGGQDEQPAQPNAGSYAGWTPPVPQDDVAGIGHRFGQQMNMGEPFHSGVDLQAVEGTPTIAPVDGVVQRVEYNPQGLGITVILQGKDGTTHKLGHLKETSAYPGLTVSQGQDLQSKVGSTGNTTGSHLHWAVKTPDGQPTDPTASLGAMANLPPVPGTQMMGPPGGTSSPGGPQPGPQAAQGTPPTPVQSAGQPPQPMGGGQDEPADEDPLSPFGWNKQNPYGFNDRNLQRQWNIQHNRWVDQQMKKQGTWRTAPGAADDPERDARQERIRQGTASKADYDAEQEARGEDLDPGHSIGEYERNTQPEDRYRRSQETNPQSSAAQHGIQNRSTWNDSPYTAEGWNPHDKDTNPKEWNKWDRQHKWFIRQQQGQEALGGKLDKLADQGWPQGAIDEMKQLGHPPTQDEVEAIRAKYKPAETPAAPEEKQDATDWETEWERKRAAGEPTTPPPGGWEPKGVTNPTPPPDKTGLAVGTEKPPPTSWEDLAKLSPENRPPAETDEERVAREHAERRAQMDEDARDAGYNDWQHQMDEEEKAYQAEEQRLQQKYPGYGDYEPGIPEIPDKSKSVSPPIDLGGGHKPPVGPSIEDLSKPNIFMPPVEMPGGHIPVPLPEFPQGHVPGPEVQLPEHTEGAGPPLPDLGDVQESVNNWWDQRPAWLGGAGADTGEPSVPAEPGHQDMSSEEIMALLMELIARMQAPRSGMGAGLQLGPVHLSTSMRQPMRMPSSRMEMGRRAGWTPRAGGMKRRSSAGTSAMLDI